MKITWEGTHTGQVGFHAELQEYDAVPPVGSLLIDHAPSSMNLEREAMAGYLAFGHWTSGDLQLPHGLGPNTAAAIERDMQHVSVRPSPIEYYPKPLEVGPRTVHVGFTPANIARGPSSLTVLPASEWTGSMRALQSLVVASNAFALDAAASGTFEAIRARLSVAILFAGDLSADTLHIDCPPLGENEKQRIRELLLAVRLGADFSDGPSR